MNNKLNLTPMAATLSGIAARLPDIFVPRRRAADKRGLSRQYRALDRQVRRYIPASPERLPLVVVYDQPTASGEEAPAQPPRTLVLELCRHAMAPPVLYELDVSGAYVEDVLAGFGIEQALVCGMTVSDGSPMCFLGLFHRHHIDHLVLLRAGAPVFVPVHADGSSSTLAALHKIVRLAEPDRIQLLEVFAPHSKVATELSPQLVRWLHSVEGKAAPFFRGPLLRRGHRTAAVLN